MSDFDELMPVFVEEARQHLQTIEPDILTIEQSRDEIDPGVINRIFRGIHSIKGASGFFGLQNIGKLSHIIENSLALLRDGKITADSQLIDALLRGVDTLRELLDNVETSEEFNIDSPVASLQHFVDNAAEPQKTVIVAEKKPDREDTGNHTEKPSASSGKFHVNEADIADMVSKGLHLYAVKIFLSKDLKQKNRTPFEFINIMESLGQYMDSFLDIGNVSGLSDCLDNDLAFDVLFATVLEPEIVAEGLDIAESSIAVMDIDKFKKAEEEKHKPETAPLQPRHKNGAENPGAEKPDMQTPDSAPAPADAESRNNAPALPSGKKTAIVHTEEKIRVSVSFLNDLMNLAGELVLGRNQLLQIAMPMVKNTPGLNPVLQHINRVTSEMQERIMQMRMQPISLVFGKFHRLVRSLAKKHLKEVRLVIFGEDVELDKSIIEGLSDPLTHLVRNSVDHGIEAPDEREKLGKPRQGTIELKAFHQGGQVHLLVSDDGRGVDGKFVATKALEKGIITRSFMDAMTEKDRVRLIFRAGFSTLDKVTDLSGRGVGMDVVITNIEMMGGTVDVDTSVGKGTKITLVLPLTLAIVSGLLISSQQNRGDQFFIIPEVDIDELVRVKPEEIKTRINKIQDAHVLRLRDVLLPLVSLNKVLGISETDRAESDFTGDISKPLRILVVKHGSARYGLIVDSIVSTEEIVVKPLPRYLKKMKTFSGVTILGNGTVSLILDVAGILKKADIRNMEEIREEMKSLSDSIRTEQELQTFLLFDNRTEERFALPLELISRIELVSASDIERIKDRHFLQYHDKKLRLIFLEDYLPVHRPERSPDDTVGIIVPKQTSYPLGIVMNRVINTVAAAVELDTATITAPGLFGTAVLDKRITLIPDMYRLFELAAPEWYNTEKAGGTGSGRKRRILLAEDTPFFRMVESKYLKSAGYEVIVAEDGEKAMQILENEPVDAVILDIVMPRMNGWDTIGAIREDERLRHLPVMAVTSLSEENLAEKGIKAGFDEWELKLNKTSMLKKLAKMMKK